MNSHSQSVDQSLARAQARWECLQLVRDSCILGLVLAGLVLGLGAAILRGWVNTRREATAILSAFVGLGFITWLVLALKTLKRVPGRASMAAAIERTDERFQDRLNTLLFLENSTVQVCSKSLFKRIADQARRVLMQRCPTMPFSARPGLAWFSALSLIWVGVLWFNHRFAPWEHLALLRPVASAPGPPSPNSLTLPPTNVVEQPRSWGEVRITDPGSDLKLTKVDVVPLSIEAAANQDLRRVEWYSSVNGGQEKSHELPTPAEPRYALYQPEIYLDELQLNDWDVLTYYAKAQTFDTKSYASEIYFIEVRPFREDIAKMPGGKGGQPYQTLNDISSLVGRQQHVIRDTHQFVQKLPDDEQVRAQTRKGLAQAEGDLGNAAQHLYADMASKMENKPIGAALDNLAQAQVSLGQASAFLKDDVLDQAQNHERAALAQLVAARKIFQKAVSDHPGDFSQPGNPEAAPVADSSKKLNEMAEFRNESKSAEEFVQKTLEQQKEVEQQAAGPLQEGSALAGQEQRLGHELKNFEGEHPHAFKGSESEMASAQQSLQRAEEHFRGSARDASSAAHEATQNLEKLRGAMQSHATDQQMADAYRLERMLAQQGHTLADLAIPQSNASAEQMGQAAGSAQAILKQLKDNLDQQSSGAGFGEPLKNALKGDAKAAADAALSGVQQAQDDSARRQQAKAAASALDQIHNAFAASQPKALQEARQNDSLQEGRPSDFAQGMNQLQRLLRQLEQNGQVSPGEQARQSRQALDQLQAGVGDQLGQDSRGTQLLQQLEQMLAAGHGLDPANLKKLLDQLERLSVEHSSRDAGKSAAAEVATIDPARLPPAYRSRIEHYFQKLSDE